MYWFRYTKLSAEKCPNWYIFPTDYIFVLPFFAMNALIVIGTIAANDDNFIIIIQFIPFKLINYTYFRFNSAISGIWTKFVWQIFN